jgi:hypothetical protein
MGHDVDIDGLEETTAKQKQDALTSPVFRGSFVALAAPKVVDKKSGKTEYQISCPFSKKSKEGMAFVNALAKLLRNASASAHGGAGLDRKRLANYPIINGDNQTGETEIESFKGCWVVRCKSNFKPSVVNKKGQDLLTGDEIYSGAWYRIRVTAYGWTYEKTRKGVSVSILSVMKEKDDTRFGGGENAKEGFKDFIDENVDDGDLPDDDGLDDL